MTIDRLRAIRAFKAVVEAESYSGAARKLGLSRSHLSKTIKELEGELGVQLLHRTTKQVRTTEPGQAYFEACARIVNDLDEAELALGSMQREIRGTLKVLAPKSFAVLALVPAVRDFNLRYPDLEVSLYMIDQFLDPVAHGFDVVLRYGEQPDSALVGRRICAFPQLLCASPAYLAERGTPTRPEELAGHECLRNLTSMRDSRWRFDGPDGPVTVEVRGRLSANSTVLLREALLAGYGIGIMPDYTVAREIAAGAVRTLLPGWRLPPQPLHAVYPPERPLTAKVRLFVDFLVTRFAPAA